MNRGHFFLTLGNGVALGVAGATPNAWVHFSALAVGVVLMLSLVKWMGYSDKIDATHTTSQRAEK